MRRPDRLSPAFVDASLFRPQMKRLSFSRFPQFLDGFQRHVLDCDGPIPGIDAPP